MQEIIAYIIVALLAGAFILFILALWFNAIMEGIAILVKLLTIIGCILISIPLLIFTPRKFLAGFRAGYRNKTLY